MVFDRYLRDDAARPPQATAVGDAKPIPLRYSRVV
jgi:hypothetical protein